MKASLLSLLLILGTILSTVYGQSEPLRLAQTIPMPDVHGRIDHMAIDIEHKRLFVAALGNGTLEVLDLQSGKISQTIPGLKEPQGVLYIPEMDKLFVATGGDGKCYVYSGEPRRQVSAIDIGDDADNIRYDAGTKRVYIGYGKGALAIIDAFSLKRLADIKLAGHPESFQIEQNGSRIYVNVPDERQLAVVDRNKQAVVDAWRLGNLHANYPMALIEAAHRLLIATRKPAKLAVLDSSSGKIVSETDCVGDADDLFYDSSRKLVYVSGGEGIIDVFEEQDSDHYMDLTRINTAPGARTSLWVPQINQFFLAVPRRAGQEASIRIYQGR